MVDLARNLPGVIVVVDKNRVKAGAYAIQGRASRYVERVDGCYFNVMGLPVAMVYAMLHPRTSSAGANRGISHATR